MKKQTITIAVNRSLKRAIERDKLRYDLPMIRDVIRYYRRCALKLEKLEREKKGEPQ